MNFQEYNLHQKSSTTTMSPILLMRNFELECPPRDGYCRSNTAPDYRSLFSASKGNFAFRWLSFVWTTTIAPHHSTMSHPFQKLSTPQNPYRLRKADAQLLGFERVNVNELK